RARLPRPRCRRAARSRRPGSQPSGLQLGPDPWNDLIKHGIERRGRLESEYLAGLADVRDAALHVVLERRVADEPKHGTARPVDLPPDRLGELEDRGRGRGGEVEVVVQRLRRLHRDPNAPREIAAVRVMPDLVARAEDVQRVLALERLE